MIDSLRFTSLREPAWLLVLLVPAVYALYQRSRRRGPRSVPLGPSFVLATLPSSGAFAPRLSGLLHSLGLVLLALAMARPVERVPLPPEQEGMEILLVIDRSSSMEARDLDAQRTRLQVAVDAATRFVEGRSEDRIGLIGFARYPDLLSPTSLDHAAVLQLLAEVEMVERDGPEDLTGIGAAVARAAQVLRPRSASSKSVVLLTDGQENVATPAEPGSLQPLEAAALCRAWGVRVYPIAIASAEPAALQELARATGGRAFAARGAAALGRVWGSLDQLAKSPLAETEFEEQDRFPAWLAGAVGLLLLAWGLRWQWAEVLP